MIFFEKLYYLNRHDRRGLLMLLTVAAAAFGLMFWVGPTEPTAPDAAVQPEKAGAFTNSATEDESHQYYARLSVLPSIQTVPIAHSYCA